jgi:hypothetical protein
MSLLTRPLPGARRPRAGIERARAAVFGIVLLTAGLSSEAAAQQAAGRDSIRPSLDSSSAVTPRRRPPAARRQVAAERAHAPVRVDGVLDEEVWMRARPAEAFVQSEPRTGDPATERTEVRVVFDDEFLYIGARLYDATPDGVIVNDIRKDFSGDDQDTFEVLLDTFGDRRNGYVFATNAEGARSDRQVALEGREVNLSWDAVWEVRTRRLADGWTAEFAIPFRALRFDRGNTHGWGINFSRRIRRNNEIDFWSPVPRAYNITRVSLAGDLLGLETSGRAGRDLRVKPYALATTVRESGTPGAARPAFDHSLGVGAYLKYALTPGVTLDLTARPDFAQAEADEQQVNLTQFSQFFPEKRDFFLENSGIFYIGDAARSNNVNPSPTPDEDLLLFFSRRIGLSGDGAAIPIDGGVRLTGQLGESNRFGLLNMQTRAAGGVGANNYAVARIRHNLYTGSDVGAIVMQRTSTDAGGGYNRVYGLDWNLRYVGNLDLYASVIRTRTPDAVITHGEYAWRTSINRETNFLHVKAGIMAIGPGFNDEMGYLRRTDVRKWFADVGVRPRLASLQRIGIREMHPHLVWNYYESLDGHMLGKSLHTGYTFFLSNGGYHELSFNPQFQLLTEPLTLSANQREPIPAGAGGWNEMALKGSSDPSRAVSLSYSLTTGGLWSGTQRTDSGTVTLRPNYRFRLAVGGQRTAARLDDPRESFVRSLATMRASYSFSTRMFVDALSQYDPAARQFNANVRFNLIHHPLSDLFIVLNDQRVFTGDDIAPGRSVIVKFTQMIAM